MENKPLLAIISDDIRRDLHAALKNFSKIRVIHLYRLERYTDMKPEDFFNCEQYKDSADLYQKLQKYKPDIIQGPEPYASRAAFLNSLKVLSYCKKFKVPFFFPMFENVKAETKFGLIVGKCMKWYLKRYCNAAAKIIPINNGAKINLKEAGAKSEKFADLIWATWGVDEQEFYPKPSLRPIDPLILFVGKIEPQKGIYNLIEAFQLLKNKIPKLRLNLVGPTGNSKVLEVVKKIPGIKILGIIKNKELPRYMQEAWVTCVPSIATKIWAEQVGMVNIQSIACGTPIVSTFSGAIPHFTPDKVVGLLVKENNSKELAGALEKIIMDKALWQKLSCQGAKYAKEHYNIKKNINRAETFILNILGNHDE